MEPLLEYLPKTWQNNQKPSLKQLAIALVLICSVVVLGIRFSLQAHISTQQLANHKLQAELSQLKTAQLNHVHSIKLKEEHQHVLSLLELIANQSNQDKVLTELHLTEEQLILQGLSRSAELAKQFAEKLVEASAKSLKLLDFSLSEETSSTVEFKLRFLIHD